MEDGFGMVGRAHKAEDTQSKVRPIRPIEDVSPLRVISVNELLRNEYEPVKWIIPDILPEGLTNFSAAPKIGKSMVALAIALRMARRVHGGIDGDTLYLSLDDISERRLQGRIRSLLQGEEVEDHVFIATESQSIDTGLIGQLEMWMHGHPATALIVIDVYAKVKPKRQGDDVYLNAYNALEPLRTFATKHRIAIILIHHDRKQKDGGDWINNSSGSSGHTGACDTLWHLERVRSEKEMILRIDGREYGLASEVGLTLEDLNLPWVIDGTGTVQELNESEQKVIDVLQTKGVPLAPKQISELSGLENTRMLIRRMLVKNLVTQTTYGAYTLPESNKSNKDENVVTLSEDTPQAVPQARVTENESSEKPCYSVTLEEYLPEEPDDIRAMYEESPTPTIPYKEGWGVTGEMVEESRKRYGVKKHEDAH